MENQIEIIRISKDRKSAIFLLNGDTLNPMVEYITWFDTDQAESLNLFEKVWSDEITRGWDSESVLLHKDYSCLDDSEVKELIEFMYNEELYWGEMKGFDTVEDLAAEAINTFSTTLSKELLREEMTVENFTNLFKSIAA